ncbi:MAG: hypothetical protein RR994_01725, partial [Clostridia bacterium]
AMKKSILIIQMLLIFCNSLVSAVSYFGMAMNIPWSNELQFGGEIACIYAIMAIICFLSILILSYFNRSLVLSAIFGFGISAVLIVLNVILRLNAVTNGGSWLLLCVPGLLLINTLILFVLNWKGDSILKKHRK